MARSQLRAWAALAVVLLASASALAQNSQTDTSLDVDLATSPVSSSPVSDEVQSAPAPAETVLQTPSNAAPVAAVSAADSVATEPAVEPAAATPVVEPVAASTSEVPAAASLASAPVVTEQPAAAPAAATPVAVPVAASPVEVPAAGSSATTTSSNTNADASTTPASTVTTSVLEAEDHSAGVPTKEEEEDPCKAIPGCSACIVGTPAKTRKLMQISKLQTGSSPSGRPTIDWTSLIKSPYDDPNLAKCTACTGEGYLQGTSGRCNCKPGYGDIYPTGHCTLCPEGHISRGGFRAVCEECTDVAYNNPEHTLCVCASGWYGYTNTVTRQATCNQCPGTRPVSKDGSRSAAECSSCPAGQQPNEIFSECVVSTSGPVTPPPPATIGDLISNPPPSPPPAPPAPPLFNESTFADAEKDWKIVTRASQNLTNPVTDLIGSVVESMIMGRDVSSSAKQPGDLIYQVLTKPPPSTQKTLENLQNIAALGAGLGAAAGALPAVAKAVGTDTPLGGLINGVAQGMGSLASNMRQGPPGIPQIPAIPASEGSGGNNLEMMTNILGQVLKNVPKAGGSSSPTSPLDQLKTLSNLAKLAGVLRPAAPAPAAATPIASGIVNAAKLLSVPKTGSGFVQVPSAPPKVTSAVNPLKALASASKPKLQ